MNAAIAVLMKFSMSLLTMPGASSVAPEHAFDERASRRRHDDRRERFRGTTPSATAMAPAAARRRCLPRFPRGHRAGSARRTRRERASPATSSAPMPCRFRWRRVAAAGGSAAANASAARDGCCVATTQRRRDRGDAGVGDGVARATAAAALLRDAEQRLALDAQPRGATAAATNVAISSPQPGHPSAQKMIVRPMSAPTIAPDTDTVRARVARAATAAFTPIASSGPDRTIGAVAATSFGGRPASPATARLRRNQGTDMLSSRRTFMLSTAAASAAAARRRRER